MKKFWIFFFLDFWSLKFLISRSSTERELPVYKNMISSSNMVQYQLKNDDYCGRRHISRHFERQSNLDSIGSCPYMLSIPCYRSRLLYIYVTFKRFELIHFQNEVMVHGQHLCLSNNKLHYVDSNIPINWI